MRHAKDRRHPSIGLLVTLVAVVELSAAPLDRAELNALIEQHGVAGIGVALIDEGRVAETIYAGLARPSVGVSADTMFNTASLAKTVTAEVALRLAAAGALDLDAPIQTHYEHPDLAQDERYRDLTARRILTHRSGLKNWVYDYDDFKLAFVTDPGSTFSYSGAAYEILGRYLEGLSGVSFPELVRRDVFEPLGMDRSSISRETWVDEFIAHPMAADGTFDKPYTIPGVKWTKAVGEWDGADDLYVSVEDFARFVIAVGAGEGLSSAMHVSRFVIDTDALEHPVYACAPEASCPRAAGYGLGWMTFEFPNTTYFQHGGTDFGEIAFAYYDAKSRSGAVVLVNGGAGHYVPLDIIEAIDPGNALASYFRGQYDRYFTNASP